ncbi:MAG TPA: DUF927 domain-containing protein [bacterium]|nr:DUF927 domain-containing protein [bacterium]
MQDRDRFYEELWGTAEGYRQLTSFDRDAPKQLQIWAQTTEEFLERLETCRHQGNLGHSVGTFHSRSRRSTNAAAFNAVVVDLDVLGHKATYYATYAEAAAASRSAFDKTGLHPTWIVASGGGFHFYYMLDEPVGPMEWLTITQKMHDRLRSVRLVIDANTGGKLTQIMRAVGSVHPKHGTVVTAKRVGEPYSVEELRKLLATPTMSRIEAAIDGSAAVPGTGSTDSAGLTEGMEDVEDPTPRELAAACPLFAEHMKTGGAGPVPEPVWKQLINLCAFTTSPERAAVAISRNYDGFDRDETLSKVRYAIQARKQQGVGMPRCRTIIDTADGCGTEHDWAAPCRSCIWRDAGHSPMYAVVRRRAEGEGARPEKLVQQAEAALASDDKGAAVLRKLAAGDEGDLLVDVSITGYDVDDNAVWDCTGQVPVKILPCRISHARLVTQVPDGLFLQFRASNGALKNVTIEIPLRQAHLQNDVMAALSAHGFTPESRHGAKIQRFVSRLVNLLLRKGVFGSSKVKIARMGFDRHFGVRTWAIGTMLFYGDEDPVPCEPMREVVTYADRFGVGGDRDAHIAHIEHYLQLEPRWQMQAFSLAGIASMFYAAFASTTGTPIISLTSPRSGTGKSVALEVSQSMFGNPDLLGTSVDSSINALHKRFPMMGGLPTFIDEGAIETRRAIGLFSALAGTGREVLSRTRDTVTVKSWKSLLVIASNQSPIRAMKRVAGGAAGLARVLDIEAPPLDASIPMSQRSEMSALRLQLRQDYGYLSHAAARYILGNYDDLLQRMVELHTIIGDRIQHRGLDPALYRIQIDIACAVILAASMMRYGLREQLPYDEKAIARGLLSTITRQSHVMGAVVRHHEAPAVISLYLQQVSRHRLVYNSMATHSIISARIEPPIKAELDMGTGRIYLGAHDYDQWAAANMGMPDFETLVRWFDSDGGARVIEGWPLGRHYDPNAAAIRVLEVDGRRYPALRPLFGETNAANERRDAS